MKTLRRRIAFTAGVAGLVLVAQIFLEGLASFAFFGRELFRGVAEAKHTEPDSLLGWINLPQVSRPNMYGPGKDLTTNRQRFRQDGDVPPSPPGGQTRVVCSGDSFTLGYGVDDDETWCSILDADPTLEAINMGQGGYGLDQAYLWYIRDGLKLRPGIHLFAFTTWDLIRMEADRFLGYPKPRLVRDGDSVRVTNVPVPKPGLRPRLDALARAVRELRTYALVERALRRTPTPATIYAATWELARATLRDLARRDSAAGIHLLVVHLPTSDEFASLRPSNYRRWMQAAAARREFQLVDLVEAARPVFADSIASFFIMGNGHYTPVGNAWVASQLRQEIHRLRPSENGVDERR